MRSLGTRRVAQAAGAAMVAVIALAGCSAGQVAETAILKAPVSGLNTQSPDGGLLIRNLQVLYNNPAGYKSGSDAPLELGLFNQTQQSITVTISSRPQPDARANIVAAQQIGLSGGAAAASPSANPEPTGSRPDATSGLPSEQVDTPSPGASSGTPTVAATPTKAALEPARITIPALSNVTFLADGKQSLVAQGLTGDLRPGYSLSLTIEVSGSNQPLEVTAPFAIPTSPASRAPGIEDENSEE
ncbi:hypothetical protein GCM10010172_28100 [Paractinoplanes ferrugineus]|uniref:Lipoprotein n=1 Tax=Paractinoplanes ferrugineus TaxID=113564 RepID=A0A919MD96_9ACTN|nr:hypothetical protein [Actinoplanes ferrugineus]GIE08280.1 hypothetical protein Afe05nite_01200 [Actinoplanes ferrugineus]